jgi:hypothetical protein
MLGVWSGKLVCLSLHLFMSGCLYGQDFMMANRPSAVNLVLREKQHFYLSDVIDARKEKDNSLGQVIHLTRSTPLRLPGKLENVAFDFWNACVSPKNNDAQIPLVIRINTLRFRETRQSPGSVKGESFIGVQFLWYRDNEEVLLTSYDAKSNYTRPESKSIHDDFLVKMLGDALVFFDKWMTANNGKNPALVRGIRLIVEDEKIPDRRDTIFYSSDRPLEFRDFQAAPRPGRYAAMVFTSISYEGNSRVSENYLDVIIRLKVYLVKSMSWIRPESKKPNVLRHEQVHFDIAKVSAERFKKRLSSLDLTVEDHDSQIQYQFLESYREELNGTSSITIKKASLH